MTQHDTCDIMCYEVIRVTTGERIRALRTTAKMTQSELAQHMGISPSAVGMYEQGRRQPDPDIVLKLCRLYDTTADWLLFGSGMAQVPRGDPVDFDALLSKWLSELVAHTGHMYYRTAEGRRFLLTAEAIERLCQAFRIAAEVSLRAQ